MDRGAWRAIVHGAANNGTQLSHKHTMDLISVLALGAGQTDPCPSELIS